MHDDIRQAAARLLEALDLPTGASIALVKARLSVAASSDGDALEIVARVRDLNRALEEEG